MVYLQQFFNFAILRFCSRVLNLVINGLPSIPDLDGVTSAMNLVEVLNLVINGLPSILV